MFQLCVSIAGIVIVRYLPPLGAILRDFSRATGRIGTTRTEVVAQTTARKLKISRAKKNIDIVKQRVRRRDIKCFASASASVGSAEVVNRI